ncbi:MAG: preprotein translocase subunit SecY [Defluviitaleaceae bacterium]|nr:preprotein translocase subunit SecY [Defluviitaleaceae bacterium]
MFKIFINAWRVQDIRKKLLFIFLLLLIYRFGTAIPLPGVDLETLNFFRYGAGMATWDTMDTLFGMIMGGGIGSIFAMGIAPYITASIIMQLLTYAIPQLSQMQKEGEDGRKKIGQITRYMSVGLAGLQAAATVFSYTNFHGSGMNLFRYETMLVYAVATLAMVTGTIFIMWLAELLTEKGIGNGASFLIFANILSQIPMGIQMLWGYIRNPENNTLVSIIIIIVILAVFALIIAFVVAVHEGERRIPVQYSKGAAGGRSMFGNQSSYIPLKVNIAGVLSIIFAVTLLQFPTMVAQFFPPSGDPGWFMRTFGPTGVLRIGGPAGVHWIGLTLYVILIFAFTHFYTSFAVNPVEMAENMKKNGGFIPGIRPGKPTSEFIQTTVNRLSWIGSVFYALIALSPILLDWATGIPIGFGGTTLLIVIGVALEFIKQLESQLLMRHYKGFLS